MDFVLRRVRMTSIFLSDVHLREADSLKAKLLIRFLQQVAGQYDRIYILGDLFDAWPGTSRYLVTRFRPVLSVLKRLGEEGHSIHYVEGNHDFSLGRFFTEGLGIQVHPDGTTERWGDKRIYMAHGDLGNGSQIGYRVLRSFLRNSLTQRVRKSIPQEWVYSIALQSSILSRTLQDRRSPNGAKVREIFRQNALSLFHSGYDFVIMGHTHLPDDFSAEIDGRLCRYINTGDWVSHFTYLEFNGHQFYTRKHPVTDI